MALRAIRLETDEVLRKKCKDVKQIDDRIIQLLDDMAETMYNANGVGLAAPQVGVLKRVVVIDIGEGLIELINPSIIEMEGEQIGDEACLSIPGKAAVVARPNYCKVKAIDRNGNEIIVEGEELMARAFCHEIDHLDGILYIDNIVEGEELREYDYNQEQEQE